jgi:sulfonate transport system substrate-binding protein
MIIGKGRENTMKKYTVISLVLLLATLFGLTGCGLQSNESTTAADTSKTIKIGYQKFNSINILKATGYLEKRLQELHYKVEWVVFPGGHQLVEALSTGNIDFGHAADGVGVFAQVSGKPIVYVASEAPYPKGVALLVPKNSPIQTPQDLKGKKVAVIKGGNHHYLLVKALEKAGLKYEDIEPVYVKDASEGRVAFESGKIDALGFWEPFYAVLQNSGNARVLVDGEGYTENRTYYFASETFSKQHPDLIKVILEELQKSDRWANENPAETAKLLAPELQIDPADLELATKRRKYGVEKIDDHVIRVQQELADTFYQLGLIPKQIKIADVIEKDPKWLPSDLQ